MGQQDRRPNEPSGGLGWRLQEGRSSCLGLYAASSLLLLAFQD